MKKYFAYLQKIEDFILFASFVVMIIASFAQVLNRNILHLSLSWLEELARYAMVYMALLAAEAGLRDGSQISLTILTDRCSDSVRKILNIIAKIVVIVFAAFCFWNSFDILQTQLSSGQLSPGLRIPMVIPYCALPLSLGIVVVVQTLSLVSLVIGKSGEK